VSGFSVCFLVGQQAFGQITTSDIVGTVSDATGAVVMNAKVAVTITPTSDTRKQLSGSDGGFVFNPLLPGPYTVTVQLPSFSRMLSNVTVVAGDRARVDAQLLYCRGGPWSPTSRRTASTLRAPGCPRATSKDAGTGRWGTCSRKLIPRRRKRCFISTNRTCWNKA
jgi:hypothetical protein